MNGDGDGCAWVRPNCTKVQVVEPPGQITARVGTGSAVTGSTAPLSVALSIIAATGMCVYGWDGALFRTQRLWLDVAAWAWLDVAA